MYQKNHEGAFDYEMLKTTLIYKLYLQIHVYSTNYEL